MQIASIDKPIGSFCFEVHLWEKWVVDQLGSTVALLLRSPKQMTTTASKCKSELVLFTQARLIQFALLTYKAKRDREHNCASASIERTSHQCATFVSLTPFWRYQLNWNYSCWKMKAAILPETAETKRAVWLYHCIARREGSRCALA